MTLFKNKYRIETARLAKWNYKFKGSYFITICTKNRINLFGKIEQNKMILNAYGHIVEECWFDLPNHYPNLILDSFVIMPNHIHGIMVIDNGNGNNNVLNNDVIYVETGFKPVSTIDNTNNSTNNNTIDNQRLRRHGIFEFVRAFKTFSSKRINQIDQRQGKSRWQSRFFDRIIRNESELQRIRKYIYNNPATWENDSLKS